MVHLVLVVRGSLSAGPKTNSNDTHLTAELCSSSRYSSYSCYACFVYSVGFHVLDGLIELFRQPPLCIDTFLRLVRTGTRVSLKQKVTIQARTRTSVSPIARRTKCFLPVSQASLATLSNGVPCAPAMKQPASCAMTDPAQMSHGLNTA